MSHPNPSPLSARDWLNRAIGKLALAKSPLPPDGFLEDLCFFAQQAAEIAIKAVYQQHNLAFQYTHDLQRLLDALDSQGVPIPPQVRDADQLTVYAAQTRYPGLYAPVTDAEWKQAVQVAEDVIQWAETQIP